MSGRSYRNSLHTRVKHFEGLESLDRRVLTRSKKTATLSASMAPKRSAADKVSLALANVCGSTGMTMETILI